MNLSNDCKFPCSRTLWVMWTLGLLRSSLSVIKRVDDAWHSNLHTAGIVNHHSTQGISKM
jgi:hypothetical protein